MEKGSIFLSPEELQSLSAGNKTIQEVLKAREVKAKERAEKNESYRLYLEQRQARMESAVQKGIEQGISNIGLEFNDLLVKGFDARKDCQDYVNWDVEPIKGQFSWFSKAGIYYDSKRDDFFYVRSIKVKGQWIQRIYPMTQRGYDMALELASS